MAYSNNTGLPSVTTILNAVSREWSNDGYYTEESRERGTAVHAWCGAYSQKRFAIPVRQEWRGYCESFKLWAYSFLIGVVISEKRMISTFGYCGKLDLACHARIAQGVGVVDIKTGAKEKSHPLQIAGYRQLCDEAGYETRWGAVLRLKKDGSMPIVDKFENYKRDLGLFMSCLNVYTYFGG